MFTGICQSFCPQRWGGGRIGYTSRICRVYVQEGVGYRSRGVGYRLLYPTPLHMGPIPSRHWYWHLVVATKSPTVGKRLARILLECFLVTHYLDPLRSPIGDVHVLFGLTVQTSLNPDLILMVMIINYQHETYLTESHCTLGSPIHTMRKVSGNKEIAGKSLSLGIFKSRQ